MTTEVKNLLFQDKSPKLSFYIKYIRAVDLHMQKERDEYMKEVSKDRKKYLRKIRLRKKEILITQIAIVIAFIALWEILAQKGKIDSFTYSELISEHRGGESWIGRLFR